MPRAIEFEPFGLKERVKPTEKQKVLCVKCPYFSFELTRLRRDRFAGGWLILHHKKHFLPVSIACALLSVLVITSSNGYSTVWKPKTFALRYHFCAFVLHSTARRWSIRKTPEEIF